MGRVHTAAAGERLAVAFEHATGIGIAFEDLGRDAWPALEDERVVTERASLDAFAAGLGDGSAHLLYQTQSDGARIYLARSAEGRWRSPEALETLGSLHALAVGPGGAVHLVHTRDATRAGSDTPGDGLVHGARFGDTWEEIWVQQNLDPVSIQLLTAGDGQLHLLALARDQRLVYFQAGCEE